MLSIAVREVQVCVKAGGNPVTARGHRTRGKPGGSHLVARSIRLIPDAPEGSQASSENVKNTYFTLIQ